MMRSVSPANVPDMVRTILADMNKALRPFGEQEIAGRLLLVRDGRKIYPADRYGYPYVRLIKGQTVQVTLQEFLADIVRNAPVYVRDAAPRRTRPRRTRT